MGNFGGGDFGGDMGGTLEWTHGDPYRLSPYHPTKVQLLTYLVTLVQYAYRLIDFQDYRTYQMDRPYIST